MSDVTSNRPKQPHRPIGRGPARARCHGFDWPKLSRWEHVTEFDPYAGHAWLPQERARQGAVSIELHYTREAAASCEASAIATESPIENFAGRVIW